MMTFETCIGTVTITDAGDVMFRKFCLGRVEKLQVPEIQRRNGKVRTLYYEASARSVRKAVADRESGAQFVARTAKPGLEDAGQMDSTGG